MKDLVMNGLNIIVNTLLATTITWFGSYLYYYLWVIYHAPQPIYGYLLFLTVFSVVTMVVWWRGGYLITTGMEKKHYLMLWLLLYAAYGIFAFLRSSQDQIAQKALVDVAKLVVLTGGFSLLLRHTNHLRVSENTFALLTIFASAAAIFDFVQPLATTEVPGRGAGLYLNANIAGTFIVYFMILAIRPLRLRWRLVLVLIAGLGISVTFSREAWIMWGFVVMVLAWLGYFSRRYRIITAFFGAIAGIGLVLALLFGGAAGLVRHTGIEQYLTYGTAQRLGLRGEGQLEDSSAASRLNLIKASLHEAEKHPFAGNGLGYTQEWQYSVGPHNMFLLFFVEGGIVGVLLYAMMLIILWISADPIGKILVTIIAINSLFSHFLLQQPVVMLLMAYIASSGIFSHVKTRNSVAITSEIGQNFIRWPHRLRTDGGKDED